MNIALLMMGGNGKRFEADVPKQFIDIKGQPLFSYIMKALDEVDYVDKIIVISHVDWTSVVKEWSQKLGCNKVVDIVAGGKTRSESVFIGLKSISEIATDDDIVLIYDATHPYVDEQGIKELILAVKRFGGATLGQRQYDTCYKINEKDFIEEVIPRQTVVSGASPEAFKFGIIYEIYNKASEEELNTMTSAGAIALAHGIKMKVCTLHTLNLKITFPEDMEILKQAPKLFFK